MIIIILLLILLLKYNVNSNVFCINDCNGHGKCVNGEYCNCEDGWGSENDASQYKSPNCGARICPSARSWAAVARKAPLLSGIEECSGVGLCDRSTGQCICPGIYTGASCNRIKCFNDCSGHGHCHTMKQMASMPNAFPLNANKYSYQKYQTANISERDVWDQEMIQGCVCDSSWPVGLQSGARQDAEWFGADCSLRHCPSGDDPMTSIVETNCTGKNVHDSNTTSVGAPGNLCHVDCSNRGLCDYGTGICYCFNGFRGVACEQSIQDSPQLGENSDQTAAWQQDNLFGIAGNAVFTADQISGND